MIGDRQFREEVWKASFKPLSIHVDFDEKVRARMGLQARYESARMAIGLSLAQNTPPPALSQDVPFGKGIAGEYLFGPEIDLWICLILLDGQMSRGATIDDFRRMVESHWARGLELLNEVFEQSNGDEGKILRKLAMDYLPEDGEGVREAGDLATYPVGQLLLKVGSVSTTYPGGQDIQLELNGQGTSPHIALMGKVGSGKTTTAIQIADQIIEKSKVPILLIDPKGEFINGTKVAERLKELIPDISVIEVGQDAIPLDFLPEPNVGTVSIQNAAMQLRDSIALCCKGAGNIQQDLLRESIQKVIHSARSRDLNAVKEYYKMELDGQGKPHDSIMSRLNELTSMKCFTPTMNSREFFGHSWILSLRFLASEELKRLVILLTLDALKAFILAQSDAPVLNGFRSLRHLLLIDEARRILSEKKYQSLVDLVRQGRSKGSVVMLISQDPSDFDGQADDFTTQLGTVIAFACSQSQQGLRALQGVFGRKLQPREFADTDLPPGVAFTKLPGRHPERILCWKHNAS